MRVICSYCGDELGERPPLESKAVTHAMCHACADHYEEQWAGLDLGDYLGRFDTPIIVIDSDRRVVTANDSMLTLLRRSEQEIRGLRGGEAMDCAHSRLRGGCGSSVHCKTCTIRNSVVATLESGEPQRDVPATLTQESGEIAMRISTAPLDGGSVVVVTVEPVGPEG